ncbi:hypothetical protein A2U01_0096557, partial [Trifolium medium]|nr:hypothetical protein [Trifolium medium]
MWRAITRAIVARGRWIAMPVVSSTSARGRPLFGH